MQYSDELETLTDVFGYSGVTDQSFSSLIRQQMEERADSF